MFTGHNRPSPIDQDICLSMRDKATSKLPAPSTSSGGGSTSSSGSGSGGAEEGGQSSEGRLLTYTGTLSKTMVSIIMRHMHICYMHILLGISIHNDILLHTLDKKQQLAILYLYYTHYIYMHHIYTMHTYILCTHYYMHIQVLNKFSNVAYRTVLYGRKFEKNIVINDITNTIPIYANKYTNNNIYSQEILFLKLLLVLLRDGLSAAENVVLNKASYICVYVYIYNVYCILVYCILVYYSIYGYVQPIGHSIIYTYIV